MLFVPDIVKTVMLRRSVVEFVWKIIENTIQS